MITPGRILYLFKQKFGHGLTTAYYRDIIRQKIVQTRPYLTDLENKVEVHTLTSSNDLLNTLWSLKSFYFYSERQYALCIHDDGSLGSADIELLKNHFPNARIIRRDFANQVTTEKLREFPYLSQWRNENPFALKAIDFVAFSNSERVISLDSDILFFDKPTVLLERIDASEYQSNTLNKDWRYGYSPELEELQQHIDFQLIPLINSGLGLIHRHSIVYEQLEQYLMIPGITAHPYGGRSEQTLFALSCCRFGFEFLPESYDVHLEKTPLDVACRHYVSPIRHMMYGEGIKRLVKNRFLEALQA